MKQCGNGVRKDSDTALTVTDTVLEGNEFGPTRRARCVSVLVGAPADLLGPAAEAEALVLHALDVIRRMPPIREISWLGGGPSVAVLALRQAMPDTEGETIRPTGEEIDMADHVLSAVWILDRFDRMLVLGRCNRMSWRRLEKADPHHRRERALRDARKRALLAIWSTLGED
jgi:hypothetical protein